MNELVEMFGGDVKTEPVTAPAGASPANPPDMHTDESLLHMEQTTPMSSLAHTTMSYFRRNVDYRRECGQDERMDYAIRSQTLTFFADQREKLARMFPPEVVKRMFTPITSTKIRAAKSLLIDLCNQSGEPLFHIEPSPVPDVPMSVEQEAADSVLREAKEALRIVDEARAAGFPIDENPEIRAKLDSLVADATSRRADDIANYRESYARTRAKRMEKAVWDRMEEGGFNDAFYDAIDDCCTYGTGGILGPIRRVVADKEIVEDRKKKTKTYRMVYRSKLVYRSVSPQDMYPSPDAKKVEDGPFIIRETHTPEALFGYADSSDEGSSADGGWIRSAVRDLLVRHPNGGVKLRMETFDTARRECERNGFDDSEDCTFEAVHAFIPVRGHELIEMGIFKDRKGKKLDANRYYRVEDIVIDNRVVFCRIYDDVLGIPFSKCTFYQLPGSWWGESIADKLAATQLLMNNTFKALLNNMASSSGGVYWVNDVQRMANKSPDALKIKAGKVYPFNASMVGNTGAPMGVLSVQSVAAELLGVWKHFQTQADLDSGIPSYTEGQSAGSSGALRTAQGLAMFTEMSTRGMKMVMTSIDHEMISRVARLTADYELLFGSDQSLKGDVHIRSVGLIGKIMKARRDQSRLQIFQLASTNPALQQIIGVKGIVSLFRPSLEDVDINPDDILPSKGRMEDLEMVEAIKMFVQASQPQQMQEEAKAAAQPQGGGVPGVEVPKVEMPQGGVEERRSVA